MCIAELPTICKVFLGDLILIILMCPIIPPEVTRGVQPDIHGAQISGSIITFFNALVAG
jgi:hypothetical protein